MQAALVVEFATVEACVAAIRTLRQLGHTELDAYLPYPEKAVDEALALPRSPLPGWVFVAGLVGALVGYGVLWWTQNVDYPLNVGGHPTHAAAAYVAITFETAVLFASVAAFFGLLRVCRLPRLFHPAFELPGFERASVDRFFVVVGDGDREAARASLEAGGALRVAFIDLEGRDA